MRRLLHLILALVTITAHAQLGSMVKGEAHGDPESDFHGHIQYSGGHLHLSYHIRQGVPQAVSLAGAIRMSPDFNVQDEIDAVTPKLIANGSYSLAITFHTPKGDSRKLTLSITPDKAGASCPKNEPQKCRAAYVITSAVIQ